MAGQRPTYRLTAKKKGGTEKIEIGAAWPSEKVSGSYGMRLSRNARKDGPAVTGIVLADGEIVDLSDYWINLDTVDGQRGGNGGGSGAPF